MYHAAIPFRSLTDPADLRQHAGHAGIESRGGLSERMPLTPEERAREKIDRQLAAAGWVVQDHRDMDIHASVGVAVREYPLTWQEAGEPKSGSADYLLYADGRATGVVEAKPAGHTLQGVILQSQKYTEGLHQRVPAWRRPLPFAYESTGEVTQFTNRIKGRWPAFEGARSVCLEFVQ